MVKPDSHIVLCNGAKPPKGTKKESCLILEYDDANPNQNVKLKLNEFVSSVLHLDKRIKDLIEIAGYIYAADRKTSRGDIDNVEYQSWSRKFHFHIRVRDYKFWNRAEVKKSLSDALCFLSGDKGYDFTFSDCGVDFPANLFDGEKLVLDEKKKTSIVLFSGGLDSLAGIIERLETTDENLCLVSHQSGQPSIKRTQKQLVDKLNSIYDNRCSHYKFKCSLTGVHAIEETQRTRSFLYTSIAYAIAGAQSQNVFYIYENGITSINFAKRQDLINARASRTTHPKSLALLEKFFNLIKPDGISIIQPYILKTKTDIVTLFKQFHREHIIDSSVSCSKSFQNTSLFTHCGRCSQCIDRRFAMYGSSLEAFDENGIYEYNFLSQPIDDGITKSAIVDYLRLVDKFNKLGIDSFYGEFLEDLADLDAYLDSKSEGESTEKLFGLVKQHSDQVSLAISRMREKYDLPFSELRDNSFFKIIGDREYKKPEPIRFAEQITEQLKNSIPIAFKTEKPKNENSFNDYIDSFLSHHRATYEREFPIIKFALGKSVPDHSFTDVNIFIESKYIRGKTSPSVVNSGIAEDLTKYPKDKFKLFIVYDPEHQIIDEKRFCKDFEKNDLCKIVIIR